MAVNLDAIRAKVAELSGQRRSSNINIWRPEPGDHRIRLLPWKDSEDGQPFKERWFYYLGNKPSILTPHQFGKSDPINDLIRKLYSSGKPDDKTLAKKLQPKLRIYAPVLVRGGEDKNVQIWSFGKQVYQRLLGFFMDGDIGDILDPETGWDLLVKITQTPGKQFPDTTVDVARRSTKLSDDPTQAKAWLDGVPNIDDIYKLRSFEEISNVLTSWLNEGQGTDNSVGMEKPMSAAADLLDDLEKEVKATKPVKKKPQDEAVVHKSLDAAFDDLLAE